MVSLSSLCKKSLDGCQLAGPSGGKERGLPQLHKRTRVSTVRLSPAHANALQWGHELAAHVILRVNRGADLQQIRHTQSIIFMSGSMMQSGAAELPLVDTRKMVVSGSS